MGEQNCRGDYRRFRVPRAPEHGVVGPAVRERSTARKNPRSDNETLFYTMRG
jgi:hypothetical protein